MGFMLCQDENSNSMEQQQQQQQQNNNNDDGDDDESHHHHQLLEEEEAVVQKVAAAPKQIWKCDVCNVREFESFDEACLHEEACLIEQQVSKAADVAEATKNKDPKKKKKTNQKVHPFFQKQGKKQKQEEEAPPAIAATAAATKKKKEHTDASTTETSKKSATRTTTTTHPFFQKLSSTTTSTITKAVVTTKTTTSTTITASSSSTNVGRPCGKKNKKDNGTNKKKKASSKTTTTKADDTSKIKKPRKTKKKKKVILDDDDEEDEEDSTNNSTNDNNKHDEKPTTRGTRRSTRRRAATKRTVVDLADSEDDDDDNDHDSSDNDDDDEDDEVVVLAPPTKTKSKTKKGGESKSKSKKQQQQQQPKKSRRKMKSTTTKTNNNNNKDNSSLLAPVFAMAAAAAGGTTGTTTTTAEDTNAFLNEQATAVFRAQRLQKQKEQQERNNNKKRRKELQLQQQQSTGTAFSTIISSKAHFSSSSSRSTTTLNNNNNSLRYSPAPRFPVPSHVLPTVEKEHSSSSSSSCDEANRVERPLVLHSKPHDDKTVSEKISTDNNNDVYPYLLPPDASIVADQRPPSDLDEDTIRHNIIQQLLARLLTISDKTDDGNHPPDLYQNRGIDDGLVMKSHPAVPRVSEFLHKFMVERTKANDRRDERLRALAEKEKRGKGKKGGKTKNRNKRKYEDDGDELWDDGSDDEFSNNSKVIESLCLISGPVGCCKTSLVHAVANDHGCNVVEINTCEKRSSAFLKKAVQEATQSHSSLEMLSKNNNNNKKKKNAVQSLFERKNIEQEEEEEEEDTNLLDTDSEDEHHDDDDDDEDNSSNRLSSVTVILLDEVDNLFEGDAGFWPALIEVSQKSKCPIFLTANSVTNIDIRRVTHISITRPTPTDCVPILKSLIRRQGLELIVHGGDDDDDQQQVASSSSSKTEQQLRTLAELCHCDMRYTAHLIQSFAYSSTAATAPGPMNLVETTSGTTTDCTGTVESPNVEEDSSPLSITSVKPRSVRNEEYVLLTISGNGFTKLASTSESEEDFPPVTVWVGDQVCPEARIINDATIVAVKAPCPPPVIPQQPQFGRSSILRYCTFQPQRSLSAEYKPIKVASSTNKLGLVSTAPAAVFVEQLPDGKRVVALPDPVLLECHFSSVSTQPEKEDADDESDAEMEFTDSDVMPSTHSTVSSSGSSIQITAPPRPPIDFVKVNQLLQEGLASRKDDQESCSLSKSSELTDHELMEATARACIANSDAAVLQDLGSTGFPFLAGTSRGFGFDLTEAFPVSTNEKSKPPGEEHLFSSRWKDDCYFYGDSDAFIRGPPPSARERNMLKLHGATTVRKYSLQQADPAEISQEEGNGEQASYVPTELNEEDAFQPNIIPSCVLSLPLLLRKAHGEDISLERSIRDQLFEQHQLERMDEQLDLLFYYVFSANPSDNKGSYPARLFARGLGRGVDPVLFCSKEAIDSNVFVDYLPLLRVMSLHEQTSQHVYDLAEQNPNEDSHQLSNRTRLTRRSAQKGRQHYLENVSFILKINGDQQEEGVTSARDVGDQLAALCLLSKVQ